MLLSNKKDIFNYPRKFNLSSAFAINLFDPIRLCPLQTNQIIFLPDHVMNIAHILHPGSKRSITFKYWLLIDNMIPKGILVRLRGLKL
jgi:hypothetical protein